MAQREYTVRMTRIESRSITVSAGSLEEAVEIALPPGDDSEWVADRIANERGETIWLAG